jgi:hypothetical protein
MQEKLENEIEYVITQVSFQTMYYFHITQTSLTIMQHILILFDKNFQPTQIKKMFQLHIFSPSSYSKVPNKHGALITPILR